MRNLSWPCSVQSRLAGLDRLSCAAVRWTIEPCASCGRSWTSASELQRRPAEPPAAVVPAAGSGLLQAALQLRQRGLEQLIRCRQRLEACSESAAAFGAHRHWLLMASNDLPQCFHTGLTRSVSNWRPELFVQIIQREQLEYWDWSGALLWADAVIVCRLPTTVQVLRAIGPRRPGCPPGTTWMTL